jgi:hypothetical protein
LTFTHQRLGHFSILKKVGNGIYQLWFPASMKRLHLVFNTVKLTLAPSNPIKGHHFLPSPSPEIIDREEEWIVEEIPDSRMMNQKLCYLVKWQGFGVEHNLWKPWDNVHALELVTDFYWRHPRAACHIEQQFLTPSSA